MSPSTNGTTTAEAPAWEPETPFEETLAFETVAVERGAFSGFLETPFVSEYRLGETVVDHTADELRELLSELYDREFDDAVTQLVAEADAQLFQLETDGPADPAFRQQLLEEWMGPLHREADAMLTNIAEAVAAVDTSTLGETQLDEIFDRFEPGAAEQMNPAFQGFLGKLWKKAKKIAKGAVKLARKGIAAVGKILPIGALLGKLKQLVKPLLKKVLKLALNKLPAGLRPAAALLAKKLLGEAPVPVGESYPAAGPDPGDLQRELDLQLLALVSAADEVEGEVVVTEAAAEADQAEDQSVAELDAARARFVDEINRLQPGQDPTEAVENFVPAAMAALKVGVHLIGRPKIVNFLSKLVGTFIKPMVGKELTPHLSKAIVDLGLRAMSLEAPAADDETNLGAEAVAATVEGTVARLAAVDEVTLANDTLLELAVHRAFSEAVAANIPPDLVKAELRETHGVRGTWVSRPRGGPARYKKFTHLFRDVQITPQMAAQLVTFGGVGLDQYFSEVLGVAPPVKANIRLYEAIPGTTLPRIARLERHVPGLGTSATQAWCQFHPLTTSAAGLLLGEPALGNDVPERFLRRRRAIGLGQRFYHLEVSGARVQTYRDPRTGRVEPRVPSNWDVSAARAGYVAVYFLLSEREAQEAAARLRQGEFVNQVLSRIASVHDRLATRKFPGPDGQLWVGAEGSMRPLDPPLKEALFWAIKTWVLGSLGEEFMKPAVRNQFLVCADDPADGVFLLFLFRHPVVGLITPGPGVPTAQALAALQGRATPTASALAIGPGKSTPPPPPI